uniref:C2H2-type domain-containing protein n=11 Tax=Caenorhabditis japonica TaxID=281687 RepID=A0A8R1DIY6_CAEJA
MKSSPHRPSIELLFKRGLGSAEIARRLQISSSTVRNVVAAIKKRGDASEVKKSGRPRSVNTRNTRAIIKKRIIRNDGLSLNRMASQLGIARSTVQSIVKNDLKLKSYKLRRGQYLSDKSKAMRLEKCRKLLQHFQVRRVSDVIWTDEKIFTIEPLPNRQNQRQLLSKDDSMSPKRRLAHNRLFPKSVMVWAGITATGKTPLVFIERNVKINSEVYQKIVLMDNLLPWVTQHFAGGPFILQQDWAPSHGSRSTLAVLEAHFPGFLDKNLWPASSPDLNPMDFSVWGMLEGKIAGKVFATVDDLKAALEVAWASIDDGYLRRTVNSQFADANEVVEEETYTFEYAYEDDEHSQLHPDMQMEEEVVVAEEVYEGDEDWKKQKLNLYDVLDENRYIDEQKPSKRQRIGDQQFHFAPTTPSGPQGDYDFSQDNQPSEYREYSVYTPSRPADRVCAGCGMTLRRSVYYHHARMIREKGVCNLFTPQRFPCTQCDARIGTLEKLCQHMEQIHNAPTQIKTAIFTNEEDFKVFRIELDGKGGNFRMARGNKKNKKGVVQYFRCNRLQTLARAQTFRPVDNPSLEELPSNRKRGRLHQQETRNPSAKQVIRTENACTAFYNKAYLSNGTIEVRYCDHHLHDDEKLRLPEAVRKRVIQLARKNLPHIVVLMIIKDERLKYCDRNSANDRRIQDMKTQDVRQVLAGTVRSEKTRASRGEAPLEVGFDKNPRIDMIVDDDPNRAWADIRPNQKIDRCLLTRTELRYLDLFDSNREEIMSKLNEKTRVELDKKLAYDSFIHRLSSSHEIVKHLHYRQLIPTDSTLIKLKKAYHYLSKIEEVLMNPLRDAPVPTNHFTSFIRMMEDQARIDHERGKAGRLGLDREVLEEIDVVGMGEEEEYGAAAADEMHEEVVEEEVVDFQHGEEITEEEYIRMELEAAERGEGAAEEDGEEEGEGVENNGETRINSEEDRQGNEEEHEKVPQEQVDGQQNAEAEREKEVEEEGEGEGDEESDTTVTRVGRVVKKKKTGI